MVNPGSGTDGALTVGNTTFNMHTMATSPRTCADAVMHRVASLADNNVTLSTTPAGGCLATGDEVLLINMQGHYGGMGLRIANVGTYELLRVDTVNGAMVTFTSNKTRFYGNVVDSDVFTGTEQKVFLQRVPNYSAVSVATGGVLTGNTWSATGGGVLFFRSQGSVVVDGAIDMDGKGYGGGNSPAFQGQSGNQGESRAGVIASGNANLGGRGAGYGGTLCLSTTSYPGGGGAMATAGGVGLLTDCPQLASAAYADFPTRLYLGSGGGGGASTVSGALPGGTGGRGGGAIIIHAGNINVSGQVRARGGAGLSPANMSGCPVCQTVAAPGGGGSGGTVVLVSGATVGTGDVSGGSGGTVCAPCSEPGGAGGQGQLLVR
jgi:hypothetical protein